MNFIKSHLRKIVGFGFIIWSVALFFYADHKGYKRADDKWKLSQAIKTEEGVKNSAEIEHKNRALSDPDLDDRLLKWTE